MYHCSVESLSIYFYGTFTQFKTVSCVTSQNSSILFYHTHIPFCTIALLIHSLTSGGVILLVFLPEFINLIVASVVAVFVFLIKFVILIVADVILCVSA